MNDESMMLTPILINPSMADKYYSDPSIRLPQQFNYEHIFTTRLILFCSNSTKPIMNSSSSKTISIRPFKPDDVDNFLLWASDDRVLGNTRWNRITTANEALNFINQVCIPHPWRRSICVDDHSVGFISIFPWSDEGRYKADIGFALAVEYWGQGITTLAVKMALSQVFNDLPEIVRLQAFVKVDNKSSQRVLEKAGFEKEGLLRKYLYLKGHLKDCFIYSFLSTDVIPGGTHDVGN